MRSNRLITHNVSNNGTNAAYAFQLQITLRAQTQTSRRRFECVSKISREQIDHLNTISRL